MLHDEKDYPEPEEFKPDRFLAGEYGPARDPRTLIYGFGRRYDVLSSVTFTVRS